MQLNGFVNSMAMTNVRKCQPLQKFPDYIGISHIHHLVTSGTSFFDDTTGFK